MATPAAGSAPAPAAPAAHAWAPENAVLEFIAVLVDRIYTERVHPSYKFYHGGRFEFKVVQWVSLVAVCSDDALPSSAMQEAVAAVLSAIKPPVAFRSLLLNVLCAAAPVVRASYEKLRVLSLSRARVLYPSHLLHSVEVHAAFVEVARSLGPAASPEELLMSDVLRTFLETMDDAVHRRRFVFTPRPPVAASNTAPALVPVVESNPIDPFKLPLGPPPSYDDGAAWSTNRPFDAVALGEMCKVCADGSVELVARRASARVSGGVAVHGAAIVASYFESADWIARRLGVDLARTRFHPASRVAAAEFATFDEERNAAGEVRVVCDKWVHAVHSIVGLARARCARVEDSWQPSLVPVLLSAFLGFPKDEALATGRTVVQQLVVFVARCWIFGGGGERAWVRHRRRFEHMLRFSSFCMECEKDTPSASDAEAALTRLCLFAAYFGDEFAPNAEYWLPVAVARDAALSLWKQAGTEKAVAESLLASLPATRGEPEDPSQPAPAVRIAPDAVDVLYYYALSGRAPKKVRSSLLSEMRMPTGESAIFDMFSTASPASTTAAYYVGTKNKNDCFPPRDPRRRLAVALHEAELLRRGVLMNIDRIWRKSSPVPVGMSVFSSFNQLAAETSRKLVVPHDYVIGEDARANAWPAHLLVERAGQALVQKVCYLDGVVFVSPATASDSLVTYVVPVSPAWLHTPATPGADGRASDEARRAWLRGVLYANILPQTPSPPDETRPVDDEQFLHKLAWDELCENLEYLRDGERWRKRTLELAKATRDIKQSEGHAAVKRRRFTAEDYAGPPRPLQQRRLTEHV